MHFIIVSSKPSIQSSTQSAESKQSQTAPFQFQISRTDLLSHHPVNKASAESMSQGGSYGMQEKLAGVLPQPPGSLPKSEQSKESPFLLDPEASFVHSVPLYISQIPGSSPRARTLMGNLPAIPMFVLNILSYNFQTQRCVEKILQLTCIYSPHSSFN